MKSNIYVTLIAIIGFIFYLEPCESSVNVILSMKVVMGTDISNFLRRYWMFLIEFVVCNGGSGCQGIMYVAFNAKATRNHVWHEDATN